MEALPRQFEDVPPNSTVLRLLIIGDSLSVQEVKQGRAELTHFDPGQPDPDVLNGEVSVYNYNVLNELGNILYTGYFRADPRVHTFYPGEGKLKDRVLHDSSVSPSFFVTVCLPLDSLKQFEQIRVRKIEYQDGKPVLEISPGKLRNRTPYTTLSLKPK